MRYSPYTSILHIYAVLFIEENPMSYHNISYITNAEEQRNSELEDTESEIETKSGGSMADLNDVELISENLGDIPVKELHDYILRKHEVMDEGFKAEFKVGNIAFIISISLIFFIC